MSSCPQYVNKTQLVHSISHHLGRFFLEVPCTLIDLHEPSKITVESVDRETFALQNIESSLILNRASSSAASAANSGDLRFGGIDISACGFESVLLNLGRY